MQDQFIKKNDFEITDVEILRDYFDGIGRRVSDVYLVEPLNGNNKSVDESAV